MYDYLITGLVCLIAGYFLGAIVVARKVQRFLKKLAELSPEVAKQVEGIYKGA